MVTSGRLTRKPAGLTMGMEGRSHWFPLVEFFPAFSHDPEQPHRRPWFVVLATDPAIGGRLDLVAT